jgi:hypothetical protein
MSTKRNSLTPAAEAVADGRQSSHLAETPRPTPEDGHRLMRAFLTIKDTRLREALVTFVEELSQRQVH